MLNWIGWDGTVFVCWIELFWHWNCVLMLNWIVWNRTVYMYKNGFGINNLQCHMPNMPPNQT